MRLLQGSDGRLGADVHAPMNEHSPAYAPNPLQFAASSSSADEPRSPFLTAGMRHQRDGTPFRPVLLPLVEVLR